MSKSNETSVFELKSATLTLVSLLLKTADLGLLEQAFADRFGGVEGLFENDPLLIDLSALGESGDEVDFARLSVLLRHHKLVPLAVRAGNESQMQAALQAGFSDAQDGWQVGGPPRRPVEAADVPTVVEAPDASAVAAAEMAASPRAGGTLVIDRPLRSGQQIYARGSDLIVMAAVNVGAEVIADGSIHVYAPLRGRAIAGARGNAQARIFSTRMEPQLVSIAGVYRTLETALPDDVLGKPAQVRLDGETLLIEALKT